MLLDGHELGCDCVAVRFAARVKMITNDAAKASESKEIQRLKVGYFVACVVNILSRDMPIVVLLLLRLLHVAAAATCDCDL